MSASLTKKVLAGTIVLALAAPVWAMSSDQILKFNRR
jgi:hypothetical protein